MGCYQEGNEDRYTYTLPPYFHIWQSTDLAFTKNMPKTRMKNQFLKEFRKLSPVGKGEVFKYARWSMNIEKQERLASLKGNASEGQANDSYENWRNKRPLLVMQRWLPNWGVSI